MGNQFFYHLLKLPLDFFERRNSGDIQSRFHSLDVLHKTLTGSIVSGLISIVMVVSLFLMMILYGSWLAALVLFFTLIYFSLRIATYIVYKQASEEEIIKSAKANSYFMESIYGIASVKALGIDEIIAMSMGYETIIGELGSMLSGGQKQRIIIARVLYKNPRILFLDEATSHLDVENEQKINIEIAKLNITRVIVSHRYSTISSADRVIDLTTI